MGICLQGEPDKADEVETHESPRKIENKDDKIENEASQTTRNEAVFRLKAEIANKSSNQKIQKISDITKIFSCGKVIGQGAFGEVRQCVNRATGDVFALKIINKGKLKSSEIVM